MQLLRSPVVIGYFPWPWQEAKFVQDPIGENGKKDPYTLGKWIKGNWEPSSSATWDRFKRSSSSAPAPIQSARNSSGCDTGAS